MRRAKNMLGATLTLALVACVTVNIYFPAAAAEKAADKVIDEVWGKEQPQKEPASEPDQGSIPNPGAREIQPRVLAELMHVLIVPANAADADINVSTPAIEKIEGSMRARHGQLQQYYNSGAVGLTSDGLVTVRDPKAIPIKERKSVNQLVAQENRDRNTLYREIAKANGRPEWQKDIRNTFARRWVDRARPGWWYQDGSGRWVKR